MFRPTCDFKFCNATPCLGMKRRTHDNNTSTCDQLGWRMLICRETNCEDIPYHRNNMPFLVDVKSHTIDFNSASVGQWCSYFLLPQGCSATMDGQKVGAGDENDNCMCVAYSQKQLSSSCVFVSLYLSKIFYDIFLRI